MNILDYLKGRVKIHNVSGDEAHGYCPLHDDSKLSFSINLKTGLWSCFGTCNKGGNLAQLHSQKYEVTLLEARKTLEEMKIIMEVPNASNTIKKKEEKEVPAEDIEFKHQKLLKDEEVLKYLLDKRSISRSCIEHYKLGYDGQRIWIPIRQLDGRYTNVRKYDFRHETNAKMVSYAPGYGNISLFPMENVTKSRGPIILFEGEPDCLTANSLGLNGVTITGGSGSWKKEFDSLFKDLDVYVCYDIDETGQEGAHKIIGKLRPIVRRIQNILLPISTPPDGDFTNYIVDHKGTRADFEKLLLLPPDSGQHQESSGNDSDRKDNLITLHASGNKENYFKEVQIPVVVSGKDLAPFLCPKVVEITCDFGLKKCLNCPKHKPEGKTSLEFSQNDPELLSMIDCGDNEQRGIFKKKAKINCSYFKTEVKEMLNIEQLRVIPEIDYTGVDTEYVTRQVYSVGQGIRTNRSYLMKGLPIPNPKTQYATMLVSKMNPKQSSLDQFVLSELDKRALKKLFDDDGDIKSKLADIYRDFSHNITQIYQRNDILLSIDLVFHSVLNYPFMGKMLKKGWTECLILGDTRSGKSETISEIIKHYKAGELCTGENTSFAGLIGGMQQAQKAWSISWGKIPLNDRRLIALDEASGLKPEDISNMSGVRSSGIAEVVKIQTERTQSRTRLIWLSNPRSGRRLDTYNQGVVAVKELIGKVEDIARFDFAITAASGEVDIDKIFREKIPKVEHRYTSDICNKLVFWCWSRSPDQVVFHKEAESAILRHSELLGKKYSSTIPLVERAEQRIKIARLSVALAGRLYSTDDHERIIVYKRHVDYIAQFLEYCYTKPSMGYDLYSSAVKRTEEIDDEEVMALSKEFFKFPTWTNLRDILLDSQLFRKNELIEQLGFGLEDSRLLFKWFGKNRLIRATPAGYVKSPGFTAFLKKMLNERPDKFSEPKPDDF